MTVHWNVFGLIGVTSGTATATACCFIQQRLGRTFFVTANPDKVTCKKCLQTRRYRTAAARPLFAEV